MWQWPWGKWAVEIHGRVPTSERRAAAHARAAGRAPRHRGAPRARARG
jgi:hypothetical protein